MATALFIVTMFVSQTMSAMRFDACCTVNHRAAMDWDDSADVQGTAHQKLFAYAAAMQLKNALPQHKPLAQAGWMECCNICVAIKSHASSICQVRLWLAFGASTVNHCTTQLVQTQYISARRDCTQKRRAAQLSIAVSLCMTSAYCGCCFAR